MQIIASSIQKAGDFFLHAGYGSAQSTSFAPLLIIGGVSFIAVVFVLEFCKQKALISRPATLFIEVAVAIILFFAAVHNLLNKVIYDSSW